MQSIVTSCSKHMKAEGPTRKQFFFQLLWINYREARYVHVTRKRLICANWHFVNIDFAIADKKKISVTDMIEYLSGYLHLNQFGHLLYF